MTSTPQSKLPVFVSFDSRSTPALRNLFERLKAQPALAVWNYHEPSQAIPATAEIGQHLIAKIGEATHFLAVLSEGVFSNEHTMLEVSEALERRQAGKMEIAVFVAEELQRTPKLWPPPFGSLASFRHVAIDLSSRESVGRAVQDLCAALRIEYVPYRAEAGRLQLLSRLHDELRAAVPRDRLSERDTFNRIVQLIERTHLAWEGGDEAQATKLMQLVSLLVEQEYPGRALSYLAALRGVQLARAGKPNEGLAELACAEKQRSALGAPPDVTLVHARAYIHYQLNDFEAALADFEHVMTTAESDAGDQMSALLCRLRLGRRVELDRELTRIGQARTYAGDDLKLRFTKAIAFRLAGRHREALRLLADLLTIETSELSRVEVTRELCWVCFALNDYALAERALRDLLQHQPNVPDGLVMLSQLHARTGDTRSRVAVCRILAERPCEEHESMFEALRGLWQSKEPEEARQLALRFRKHVPLPATPFAAYISGAARWILGDVAGSRFDFERSSTATASYPQYETLLGASSVSKA